MDTDDPTVVNVWFIFVVLKMLWKDVPIIYSFLRMGDYLMEFCVLPIFGLKGPLSFSGLNGVPLPTLLQLSTFKHGRNSVSSPLTKIYAI